MTGKARPVVATGSSAKSKAPAPPSRIPTATAVKPTTKQPPSSGAAPVSKSLSSDSKKAGTPTSESAPPRPRTPPPTVATPPPPAAVPTPPPEDKEGAFSDPQAAKVNELNRQLGAHMRTIREKEQELADLAREFETQKAFDEERVVSLQKELEEVERKASEDKQLSEAKCHKLMQKLVESEAHVRELEMASGSTGSGAASSFPSSSGGGDAGHSAVEEAQKKELERLNYQLEELLMTKETMEEKTEQQAREIERLNEKVELLEVDKELYMAEHEGDTQMQLLKDALRELRELNDIQAAQIRTLERRLDTNKNLAANMEHLTERAGHADKLTKENDELKKRIEDLENSEKLVEQLTMKIQMLEENIKKQDGVISQLEEMRDLGEQLDAEQTAIQRALRAEIADKETQLVVQVQALEKLKVELVECHRTLDRFRQQARTHSLEMQKLRESREALVQQTEELHQSRRAVRTTSLSTIEGPSGSASSRAARTGPHQVELDLANGEILALTKKLGYYERYLLESFFKQDHDPVRLLASLDRLFHKTLALRSNVATFFPQFSSLPPTSTGLCDEDLDKMIFSLKLQGLLTTIGGYIESFATVLQTCDVDTYLKLGPVRNDISFCETPLNTLLDRIKANELNEKTSLSDFHSTINQLQNFASTFFTLDKQVPLYMRVRQQIDSLLLESFITSVEIRRCAEILAAANCAESEYGELLTSMERETKQHRQACTQLSARLAELRPNLDRTQVAQLVQATHSALTKASSLAAELVDATQTELGHGVPQGAAAAGITYKLSQAAQNLNERLMVTGAHLLNVSGILSGGPDTPAPPRLPDVEPAWMKRARSLKQDSVDAQALKVDLAKADHLNSQRLKAIKDLEQDLEVARLAQAKIDRSLGQKEAQLLKLQEQVNEYQVQEKMYKDAVEKLNEQIVRYEAQLREQAVSLPRDPSVRNMAGGAGLASVASERNLGADSSIARETATAEIAGLRQAVRWLRASYSNATAAKADAVLGQSLQLQAPESQQCFTGVAEAVQSIQSSRACPRVVDLSSSEPPLKQWKGIRDAAVQLQQHALDVQQITNNLLTKQCCP